MLKHSLNTTMRRVPAHITRKMTSSTSTPVVLGLDFGTESVSWDNYEYCSWKIPNPSSFLSTTLQVRAVLVAADERDHATRLVGSGSANYAHSCISQKLPPDIVNTGELPPGYVLQHAPDWIEAARQALEKAILQQHGTGIANVNIVGSPLTYICQIT